MKSELILRKELLATARSMNSCGLNQGTSGNVSVRCRDGFLLTPSALPYDQCTAEDLVFMEMSGKVAGERKPSTEWRMHRDIYLHYPDANAILHAHPVWCTALACLEKEIPPFHYMVAIGGGTSIPCAPYALFGSKALSQSIIETLSGRRACLLAHHGLVCFTQTLDALLPLAQEIEVLAKTYAQVLSIQSSPPLLDPEQMQEVVDKFTSYRQ